MKINFQPKEAMLTINKFHNLYKFPTHDALLHV